MLGNHTATSSPIPLGRAIQQNGRSKVKILSKEVVVSAADERLYRHLTLPNRMEVLLISDEDADNAAASMDVGVGSLCDPPDALGLAHFCEHMLFLGTNAFPDENEYKGYLTRHGGSCNAYTSAENTNYHFEVNHKFLKGALDIFSHFFRDPLFTESATDRETDAVDSENSKNLLSDDWRLYQLHKHLCVEDHAFHQFATGNAQTLRVDTRTKGVDVRAELLAFHKRYYVADRMRLAILGRESLDTLQAWVMELFGEVAAEGDIDKIQVKEKEHTKPSRTKGSPYGPNEHVVRVAVKPVADVKLMEVTWPLPSMQTPELRRNKPERYLGHLIGHEGVGSLLRLLKDRQWASTLSAGLGEDHAEWSKFVIRIGLTDEGMNHTLEVVELIYQYISLLKATGPQKWVFDEIREIAEMNFRFASKRAPGAYTSSLSTSMQLHDPSMCVAGPWLLEEFDPNAITSILDQMIPTNMLLLEVSWTAISTAQSNIPKTENTLTCTGGHGALRRNIVQKEPYCGAEYMVTSFTREQLSAWSSPGEIDPGLRLPQPNPLIPTDFSLRGPTPGVLSVDTNGTSACGCCSGNKHENVHPHVPSEPVLLSDGGGLRVWHKLDTIFRKPRVNVWALLSSKETHQSPLASAVSALLLSLFEEAINEFAYDASLAGLYAAVSDCPRGICLQLGGYNHKLPVLLKRVASMLRQFRDDPLAAEGTGIAAYNRVYEALARSYENFNFTPPYNHALDDCQTALEVPRWTYASRAEALANGSSPKALAEHATALLSALHVEVLVHGNATPEEAMQLAKDLHGPLGASPLQREQCTRLRTVHLQRKKCYRRSRQSPNINEPNSSVLIMLQVEESLFNMSALKMAAHLIEAPAFDQLRTREQLGYAVWSWSSLRSECASELNLLVQSHSHSADHCEVRIESFLKKFRKTLANMSIEDFESNREALVEKLLERPQRLSDETGRFWAEINLMRYDFDRIPTLARAIGELTKDVVVSFFEAWIVPGAPERRKMCFQVLGNVQEAVERSASSAAAILEAQQEERRFSSFSLDERRCSNLSLASLNMNDDDFDDEVELPDDLTEFKIGMPVFELRPIKILHVDCTPSETE